MLYNIAIDLRETSKPSRTCSAPTCLVTARSCSKAIIDPNQLEAYAIVSEELINTIVRNNRLIPAGSLDTGEGRFAVKVPSIIEQARTSSSCRSKTEGDTVVTL